MTKAVDEAEDEKLAMVVEVVVDGEVKTDWEVEMEREGTMEGGFVALLMREENMSTMFSLPLEPMAVANRWAMGNVIGSLSTEKGGIGSSTGKSGFDCFVPSLKNLDFLFGAAEIDER